jgi:hypothetical protein
MQQGLEQVLQEIDNFINNRKKNDPFISIKTIAQKGWTAGVSYSSVKKLVDSGQLPSMSVDLGGERGPLRKVHFEDLKNYITKSYEREVKNGT